MKSVALLLEDTKNLYQQHLVRAAQSVCGRHGIQLLDADWAGGSSWTQADIVNRHLRSPNRPDGMLVVVAGSQPMGPLWERVLRAGIPVVLLNRIPDWVAEVRSRVPGALLAGVRPDQAAVGRIQAEQAFRLAPDGAFVLLVTGTASSAAAAERRRAFLETVESRFTVAEVDGAWSEQGAEKGLAGWFRMAADRDRLPKLVVCQNDAMAAGARQALRKQDEAMGTRDLDSIPLIGCDGLAEEGRALVGRGELAATVVLPPTTPAALQILARYWEFGTLAETVQLEVTSFPAIEGLRAA